jgi:hypothetical protein
MCVSADAYLDVAHLHSFPTLFEIHDVRCEGSSQGFTETSVLQEHRWAFIMQIVQRIHDCFQLIEVDTQTNKGIKGGERGTNASLSPLKTRPTTKSYSRWHCENQ